MTELEDDLRAALHDRGAAVTAADLRYAGAARSEHPHPEPRRARRRTALLPLAAAAAVAAVGVSVAVGVAGSGSPNRSDVSGGQGGASGHGLRGGAALAGTRWRLVSVHTDRGTIRIRAGLDASVEFGRTGGFGANDTVNYASGHYTVTPSGIRLGDLTTTAVGYVGTDPQRNAAIQGIGAIQGTVSTERQGVALTIRAGRFTLGFVRTSASTGENSPGSGAASSTGRPPTSHPSYVNGSELPS